MIPGVRRETTSYEKLRAAHIHVNLTPSIGSSLHMSLWLPRPLLARSYSHILRIHPGPGPVFPRVYLRAAAPSSRLRFQSTKSPDQPVVKPSPPVKATPLLPRVWKKVKHEAAHYWHGSKLLVSEVRISARLQWKILHGEVLTRRERRQVCCL